MYFHLIKTAQDKDSSSYRPTLLSSLRGMLLTYVDPHLNLGASRYRTFTYLMYYLRVHIFVISAY